MTGMIKSFFYSLIMTCLFLSASIQCASAQQRLNQSQARKEMDAIGQTLNDDRTDMYDRYVYDDSQTVDKKVALNLPVLPNQDIQEWLNDTVAQIMSVTPTLYPLHSQKIYRYFVKSGWDTFGLQWKQASIPQLVLEQNYSMTALVIDTPQIVAKGRENNVYRWIVDVPILLTYSKPVGETKAYNITLRVGLTRIPMREDTQLIAIDSWGIAPALPPPEPAAAPDTATNDNNVY